MDFFKVEIIAIFFIIIIAIFVIAKIIKAQKLFLRALFSFIIIVTTFGGVTYTFLDFKIMKELSAQEEIAHKELPKETSKETPYAVVNHGEVLYFSSYSEAVAFANSQDDPSPVYFHDLETIVWEKMSGIPSQILQVPLILQFPELERGAAITSLAMMLNFAGESVHKLELAERVKKDHTPLSMEQGQIYYGHPNDGFVGNIYSADEPGLGVYHNPIRELAELYIPKKIVDMTGVSFENMLYPIHNGNPIWALIHTQFKTLPKSEFHTWLTPSGEIEITRYQHAVLITGYDEKYIYFNDPLSQEVNRPILKSHFQLAWEQMGRQAISYVK